MAFDFKKEYKEFYMPKSSPEIVAVPKMNYIAVRGKGDPNVEGGAYKGNHRIDGFFEYVVPPLEGFWWQDGIDGFDYGKKDKINWISVIRLPEFVKKEDVDWAVGEATKKKKIDCSKAVFYTVEEGLSVQMMHIGPFDDEPNTVALMDKYIEDNDYVNDFSEMRLHHEIYLSDARKVDPLRWKTVIRHPIRPK